MEADLTSLCASLSATDPLSRLLLTGFMGAGKSSVGRILASRLGWPFLDLDDAVTALAGLPVPQILAEWGESRFRELERQAATTALERAPLVLALGGGALESGALLPVIQNCRGAALIFLRAPLAELLRRCRRAGASQRPLLADSAVVERRFLQRLPQYETAHLTVDTHGLAPTEVAFRIEEALGQRLLHRSAPPAPQPGSAGPTGAAD